MSLTARLTFLPDHGYARPGDSNKESYMAISSSFAARTTVYILSPFSQRISNIKAQHRNMRTEDYIFDLTDSEYSSSDDDNPLAGQYYCRSNTIAAAILRVGKKAIKTSNMNMEAACTDARFDTILGRPIVVGDQPCSCQQCQPLSPRSTTIVPHIQEEQLEQSGVSTNTDRSGMSSISSSSCSITRSFINYSSSHSHSYSCYSSESYVPSGRCLAPIEKAIDPLECEIVDASFWVWKWPPEKEEGTLAESSTGRVDIVRSEKPTLTGEYLGKHQMGLRSRRHSAGPPRNHWRLGTSAPTFRRWTFF
ncbi:hypothetical protein L211DRAFT_850533 [Terfezia boudieri ATCC MYA-4762]|uniref:Uncharacterized protein n=1 Tax=Terfezia boudieri ATCC MYA-4762 TaxID=1051890 RepID=A0A3N4LHX2_9PEZI|nr:hypothetical protein L211DRAFT_850533 [Terfezia boudieri ATCC MYA-4762]